MSVAPLSCWVISDGRRGIENQALGLAEACHRLRPLHISIHHLEAGAAFKAASPKMQFTMRSDPMRYGLPETLPQIAIGCGRQAIAPLMALKKKAGDEVFTIYVQDPRVDPSNFDMVIAPEHDDLTGENVVTMIGAPNRITNTELISQVLQEHQKLADMPMPRVAMLIGGMSKTHKLTEEVHAQHLKAAQDAVSSGRSLMISTSRRTPDWAIKAYEDFAQGKDNVWLYTGGEPNPYIAFLGAAETILVTEDSTNMLTDACTSGKSVFTLPMTGDPGKFQKLYDQLAARCGVKPYEQLFKTDDYIRLDETTRMAEQVWAYYATR